MRYAPLLALGLAALAGAAPLAAQQPAPCPAPPAGMSGNGMMPGGMMQDSTMHPGMMQDGMMGGSMMPGGMMQRHRAMMDSMNATLDALVGRMNAARGSGKVEAMAAVINEMVSQRHAMQGMMEQMHRAGGQPGAADRPCGRGP